MSKAKIGDIEFELDDLTEKGKRMAGDLFYSRKRSSELQAELRLLSVAQSEILLALKKEFTQNNPFPD
jgi:hypothetical protein